MNDYRQTIEQIYQTGFTKFDNELITALETAQAIVNEHNDDLSNEEQCKLYLTICICKIKMDYPDDFLPMLLGAERLAIKAENKVLLIRSLNLQANHLMRTGYLQDAVQKLLNLLEIVESEDSRISNLNNLGLVYTSLGLYDKSLETLFESLRICEKSSNNRGYIRSCVNIGICYFEIHNYAKSVEYFKAAQKISDDYPFDESKMYLTVNLGLAYAQLAEFDLALKYLGIAVEMEKTHEYAKNKGSLVYNIGYVLDLMGKYDVALSHYTRALEIVRTTPNLILLVSLLNNKAGLHARLGEYKTAETLLKESLKITTDSNLMPQKLECLKQMSALYESTGKFQKALSYLNEYQTLNEMVFNDKVKNGIIKYESDYLTEKLEQKAEIYRLHNVELVEKNVIISEKQAELEVALTLLSEANATKDKLFAIIAHDLRGPVSGLQMALQIILTSNCPKADQDKMLIVLNEQTKNTFGLLENLLWWSQAQKEGFRLNIESLMLNPILDTIKSIYHTIAQTKGITMEFELDDNLCVMADKDALALVLRNLISNAIKYAPLNSAVKIKACLHGKSVEVSIIDQGSGINPNIITAIKKNNKLQSIPGTDSEIGMGLGLSLCYEFVKQMKGKLNLCNKETPGTCFCLELPIN